MANRAAALARVVEVGVANSPCPASAIAVVGPHGVDALAIDGVANLDTGEQVTSDHLWDLASLTKVLVTVPEILLRIDRGELSLDSTVGSLLPAASGLPTAGLTVAELLSHSSGLPAELPLYRSARCRQEMIDQILACHLVDENRGTALYSDLGYILLGEIIGAAGEPTLKESPQSRGWASFHPSGPAVATERCAWRKRTIVGEVHDENAYALGGVAGHAGAFATIESVAEAAQAFLAGNVISPDLSKSMVSEWSKNASGDKFGLGWWLSPSRAMGGTDPGRGSFGASGFVGNRIWIEPERGYGVVILSNRIHPLRTMTEPFKAWAHAVFDDVAAVA